MVAYTLEDRVAHFRFFNVCLSDELLEAIPFCFNPTLAFLKANHIITAAILEDFAFQHAQRGFSIQMVEYRIRFSGNLSFGLFNICDVTEKKDWWVATMMRSWNIENTDQDIRRLLFVHIIATLGCSPVVTDKDMDAPSNWIEMVLDKQVSPSEPVGHQPNGRTLCIHSLAVCPRLQGLGLGTATLKSYIQRINTIGAADRVALLCSKSEIKFFQRCGFKNIGRSHTKTLRGEYFDMVFDLPGAGKQIDWDIVEAAAKEI